MAFTLSKGLFFRDTFLNHDRIQGRLVSGQAFSGKVHGCAEDYFLIVELKTGTSLNELAEEEEELDIVTIRYDSIMYFSGL